MQLAIMRPKVRFFIVLTEPALEAAMPRMHRCDVCGQNFPVAKLRSWVSVRPGLSDLIAPTAPSWAAGKYVCKPDLVRFRRRYVEKMLERESGDLADLNRQVGAEAGSVQGWRNVKEYVL